MRNKIRNANSGPKLITIRLAKLSADQCLRQNTKADIGTASATMKTIWRGKSGLARSSLSRSGRAIQNAIAPATNAIAIAMLRGDILRTIESNQRRHPAQKATKPMVNRRAFNTSVNEGSYPVNRSQYWPYFYMK